MDKQLASFVAQHILQGADAMYDHFLAVTEGAITRFEQQDWVAVQQAAKSRIYYYDQHVNQVAQYLKTVLTRRCATQAFLIAVQTAYSALLDQYPRHDIAESFFNSVYCRLFTYHHFKRNRLFIYQNAAAHQDYSSPFLKKYALTEGIACAIERILNDTPFTRPWQNKTVDIENITRALDNISADPSQKPRCIEIMRQPFFRNKAAYLIGKIAFEQQIVPLALPILGDEKNET